MVGGVPAARRLCEELVSAGCAVGSQEQCEASIADTFATAAAAHCIPEFDTFIFCRDDDPPSCDAEGTLTAPLCVEEQEALDACVAG